MLSQGPINYPVQAIARSEALFQEPIFAHINVHDIHEVGCLDYSLVGCGTA
jgi:hypothetical protein